MYIYIYRERDIVAGYCYYYMYICIYTHTYIHTLHTHTLIHTYTRITAVVDPPRPSAAPSRRLRSLSPKGCGSPRRFAPRCF